MNALYGMEHLNLSQDAAVTIYRGSRVIDLVMDNSVMPYHVVFRQRHRKSRIYDSFKLFPLVGGTL